MMKILTMSIMMFAAVSAQAYPKVKEPLYLSCYVTSSPSTVDDDWYLYIRNEEITFFDNDHYSNGKLATAHRSKGGGNLEYTYRGTDSDDPYRVLLGFERVEGVRGRIAELYLGREHRPHIFHCTKTTKKEVDTHFEYSND